MCATPGLAGTCPDRLEPEAIDRCPTTMAGSGGLRPGPPPSPPPPRRSRSGGLRQPPGIARARSRRTCLPTTYAGTRTPAAVDALTLELRRKRYCEGWGGGGELHPAQRVRQRGAKRSKGWQHTHTHTCQERNRNTSAHCGQNTERAAHKWQNPHA